MGVCIQGEGGERERERKRERDSLVISSLTKVRSDCVKLSIHLSITLVGLKSSSHTKSIFSA